jgi:hypothetical protein
MTKLGETWCNKITNFIQLYIFSFLRIKPGCIITVLLTTMFNSHDRPVSSIHASDTILSFTFCLTGSRSSTSRRSKDWCSPLNTGLYISRDFSSWSAWSIHAHQARDATHGARLSVNRWLRLDQPFARATALSQLDPNSQESIWASLSLIIKRMSKPRLILFALGKNFAPSPLRYHMEIIFFFSNYWHNTNVKYASSVNTNSILLGTKSFR